MDGLNDDTTVTLTNEDMALVVGQLMLDNFALRKEIARLKALLAERARPLTEPAP